jgi:hypothetical protein
VSREDRSRCRVRDGGSTRKKGGYEQQTAVVHGLGYPLLAFFEHLSVDIQNADMCFAIGMLLTSVVQQPKGDIALTGQREMI